MQAKACRHPLTRSPTHPHTQTESHAPSPLMYNGANDDGEKRWWESFAGWITLNRGGYLSVTVHHWVNWHEKIMKNRAIYHLHHSPPASKYHTGWTNSPAGTVGVHLLWKPELDSSQTFQLTLWHTSWHFPCECCEAKMMYDGECVHTSSPLCITEYTWRRMLENTCIHFSCFFSSASTIHASPPTADVALNYVFVGL